MRVLQSPCLNAICIHYSFNDVDRSSGSYSSQIALALGQAPKLKHTFFGKDNPYWQAAVPIAHAVSQVDIDESVITQPVSTPESLTRSLGLGMGFVNLRDLSIPLIEYIPRFKDVAGSFMRLEKVFIDVAPGNFSTNEDLTFERVKSDMRCAFRRLKPLKYLSIAGLEDVLLLHEILERHGATMIGLIIEDSQRVNRSSHGYRGGRYPFIDDIHLARIADLCPNLLDLRLPVRRSGGNQAEVRMYRVLSTFSHMQNLILDLYGNPRPALCHVHGTYARCSRKEVLHVEFDQALINFTVDRALAKAIWREITAYQQPRSLIRLRISPCGFEWSGFCSTNKQLMLRHVARSFLVKRGGTEIVEIAGERGSATAKWMSTEMGRVARDDRYFLDTIWPPGDNDGDGSTYWKSYPLETDTL